MRHSEKVNRTQLAFLSIGLNSSSANSLREWGYTLSKLQNMSDEELRALKISMDQIQKIRDKDRSPIPHETLIKVLFNSKNTCCVCRDRSKPIIVHHIIEWSTSHSHAEENLAVLCLNDHSEAHSKREIALTLSPDRIRAFRDEWVKAVKNQDARTILELAESKDWCRWDYINHQRLFELALSKEVDLHSSRFFRQLRGMNIVDSNGLLCEPSEWTGTKPVYHLYDFGSCIQLSAYTTDVLSKVLKDIDIIDISNRWSRTEISALVQPGQFIACSGAFYFKKESSSYKGRNQFQRAYRQKGGIRLQFPFDAWDCTSSTAWGSHLRGRRHVLAICLINKVARDNKRFELTGSCLAIGAHFSTLVNGTDKY